jgi:hypothetical protein
MYECNRKNSMKLVKYFFLILTLVRCDRRSSILRSSVARRSNKSFCCFLNASNSSRLSFFR